MRLGSNAAYLFFDGVLGLGLGYLFWIIVARSLGSSVTGEASSTVTLALLIASVFTFGIGNGGLRFLGKAKGANNEEDFKKISQFISVFSFLCLIATSIGIFLFRDFLISTFNISFSMIIFVIIITISYGISIPIRSILISSLDTKKIFKVFVVKNIIKFLSLGPVFYFDLGSEGIAMSFTLLYVSGVIMLLFFVRREIFVNLFKSFFSIFKNKKDVLHTSFSSWIPGMISTIGNQSGVLFVLGFSGAAEAGVYYMAFGIYQAIIILPQSILQILFPVLSGMKENREQLLWKAVLFSFYLITPISIGIAFFPNVLLSVFGPEFVSGGLILTLLSVSILPTAIFRSVSNFSLSQGRYKEQFLIGVFSNLTRIILFIILVEQFGGEGIAASILIGSIVGIVIAVSISHIRNYQMPAKKLVYIVGISGGIGFLINASGINDLASLLITIIGSFFVIGRLGIIKRQHTIEILESIFGKSNKNVLSLVNLLFKS